MNHLASKKCEPCEGIGSALTADQAKALLPQLHQEWKITEDYKKN